MNEEADLAQFADVICSYTDVVDALKNRGALTKPEEDQARAYLAIQEPQELEKVALPPSATLYLDSLSLHFLYFCGVLGKLKSAGFNPIVSARAMEEHDALLAYEQRSATVEKLVDEARAELEKRLASGQIKLGAGFGAQAQDLETVKHPSLDIFALAEISDAVIVDDRAFNRYDNVQCANKLAPVVATFDFLKNLASSGRISEERRLEILARLRQANMAFIPLEQDELDSILDRASTFDGGGLIETAELKARSCPTAWCSFGGVITALSGKAGLVSWP